MDLPGICRRCSLHCVEYASTLHLEHAHCPKHLSLFTVHHKDSRVVLIGFSLQDSNVELTTRERKRRRVEKVFRSSIVDWVENLARFEKTLHGAVDEKVKEQTASIHDLQTAVNLMVRKAESVFQDYMEGDKLRQGTPTNVVGLSAAAGLLRRRFTLMQVVNNPAAASHGKPRPVPVYRSVHKIVRLFQDEGVRTGNWVNMGGECHRWMMCYSSFDLLPLILIDNAIKYSVDNEPVEVRVSDLGKEIELRVTSFGPIVPFSHRKLIFQKGFRGLSAERYGVGSGLGLHTAQVVAGAHQSRLLYEPDEREEKDGVAVGFNSFFSRFRPVT